MQAGLSGKRIHEGKLLRITNALGEREHIQFNI
jgi:hypothetical protein